MILVLVLDWGGGNLGSVLRALSRAGAAPELSSDPARIRSADRLVFPGVGAFGAVMVGLRARSLDAPLTERIRLGRRPTLGICVGMQALFEASEETPLARGLGVLPGAVVKLRARKVPQVGWNEVVPSTEGARASTVATISSSDPHLARGFAYYVNSFAAPAPEGAPHVAASSTHEGTRFAAAVRLGPTLAVQFHPEKSGAYGAALLERWVARSC